MQHCFLFFDILLAVHLNTFIFRASQYIYLNINQLDELNFYNEFISFLYMFRAHVLIVRRSKLYYTASGIITLKQMSGLKLLKYNSISMNTHLENCILVILVILDHSFVSV